MAKHEPIIIYCNGKQICTLWISVKKNNSVNKVNDNYTRHTVGPCSEPATYLVQASSICLI